MIMDRRGLRDKMDTPEVEDTTPRCEHCGRPLSDFGCRVVPLGTWCLQYGLHQTVDNTIPPEENPRQALVETDTRVLKAKAAYATAVEEYERAHLEWEGVAATAQIAANTRSAVVQVVSVDGMPQEWTPQGTPTRQEIHNLEEQRDTLFHVREHAGEKMIKARAQLTAVKRQAWQRLAPTAA